MSKSSCRVYFMQRESGQLTGLLLRTFGVLFDAPLPSADGPDEDSVFAGLEAHVARMKVQYDDSFERYLWTEELHTGTIRLDVPPLSAAHGRHVIGNRRIPMVMTYLYSELTGGGYRVMVPRFDAQLVLEDLSQVADVLRPYLAFQLLGEDPHSLFDLRVRGPEYVREWFPDSMRRGGKRDRSENDEDEEELRQVADELVRGAKLGKLARVVGRQPELDVIARSAQREQPPSLLLVGPSGAGKSAWLRGLAQRLAQRVEGSTERKLWSTSAERILAGLPYLGQWQERCLKLVDELEYSGNILYVDHLLSMVEPQYEGSSIADFFAAPIAERSICMIAEVTEQELTLARRANASFVSLFTIVHCPELAGAEAIELLRSYADTKPGPRLHASSYRRLLRHLEVFARDSALPGKGIRFLDWLARTRPQAQDLLYPSDVSCAYAEWSGIPVRLLSDDQPSGPEAFARELSAHVIGQPQACAVAGRVLARLKSAMTDPARPCATLLFVGPTGVGKTELAKQLAQLAFGDERRLLRFDMSEYMAPGSAMRLIEVRNEARSLVTRVREEPRSLVLLDEIEKAHPQVLDLLLGALDEGRLSDARGRAADLRGTIMVMTSNLGVRDRPAVGFAGDDSATSLAAVRAHFRPELWNRIDYLVPFRALARADIQAIVALELTKLGQRTGFVRRRITLSASASALERLTELGFDPVYGARPLKRLIEERIVASIAARLAAEPGLSDARFRIITADESASELSVVL